MVSWKVVMPCTSFLGQTVFSISKKICSYEAFPKLCENWCRFQIEIAPGCQSRYVTIAGGKTSFYEKTNKWIWYWGICVASNLRWCHRNKFWGVQWQMASSMWFNQEFDLQWKNGLVHMWLTSHQSGIPGGQFNIYHLPSEHLIKLAEQRPIWEKHLIHSCLGAKVKGKCTKCNNSIHMECIPA